MKIWNILETESEVKACLGGRDFKVGGVITHPITFTPHVYINIENYSVENNPINSDVVFIVPLQLADLVQKNESV